MSDFASMMNEDRAVSQAASPKQKRRKGGSIRGSLALSALLTAVLVLAAHVGARLSEPAKTTSSPPSEKPPADKAVSMLTTTMQKVSESHAYSVSEIITAFKSVDQAEKQNREIFSLRNEIDSLNGQLERTNGDLRAQEDKVAILGYDMMQSIEWRKTRRAIKVKDSFFSDLSLKVGEISEDCKKLDLGGPCANKQGPMCFTSIVEKCKTSHYVENPCCASIAEIISTMINSELE